MGFLSMGCRITKIVRQEPLPSHHPKGGTESRFARSLGRVNEKRLHYPFADAAHRARIAAAAAAAGRSGGRRIARRGRRPLRPVGAGWGRRLVKNGKGFLKPVTLRRASPVKRGEGHSVRGTP